ncbi:MAG TPA: TIM barrel protein, partial [Candidatus Limnocylindrales bacterium]|nr:TIM barrel protein [Candidatus Limnocylindrales bacterium]
SVVDAFLQGFDERIGLDRLVLVHLNDTRSAFGSRTDRHEHLAAGRIPPAGLAHILRHPRLTGATYILETPGMDVGYDKVNMERARALWAGKPLRRLPKDAFEVAGSARGRMAPA